MKFSEIVDQARALLKAKGRQLLTNKTEGPEESSFCPSARTER